MKRLKILFASHSTVWGGAEEYLYTILEHLSSDKYDFSLLAPNKSIVSQRFEGLGVQVISLNNTTQGYRLRNLMKISRIAAKYNMVFGNSFCRGIRIVGMAAKIARRPFIWQIHEMLEHEYGNKCLRLADHIITVSRAAHERIALYYGGRISIVNNPVDFRIFRCNSESRLVSRMRLLEKYSLTDETLILLTVGRVSKDKGIDLLMQIAQNVTYHDPRVVFLVVGDWFCDQHKIYNQLHEMKLEKKIFFTGFQKDIVPFYGAADILVHTSRKESFGRVIVEGLACGVPSIAFNVGGTGEIIEDGKSGYLIPPYDIVAFTQKVNVLLQNKGLRYSMSIYGKSDVEKRFSVIECLGKIEAIFSETCLC